MHPFTGGGGEGVGKVHLVQTLIFPSLCKSSHFKTPAMVLAEAENNIMTLMDDIKESCAYELSKGKYLHQINKDFYISFIEPMSFLETLRGIPPRTKKIFIFVFQNFQNY